jgi:hypothetical protein
MTRRALAFVCAVLFGGLGGVTIASSCVDETTTAAYTGATGIPSVTIVSPTSGSCVEVAPGVNAFGVDAFVPVEISLGTTFILRPPGACLGLTNCGQVRLTVNGSDNNVSAATIVDVDFSGFAVPYGTQNIQVELIDDQGDPWILPADAGAPGSDFGPYTSTVTITTAASCEGGT